MCSGAPLYPVAPEKDMALIHLADIGMVSIGLSIGLVAVILWLGIYGLQPRCEPLPARTRQQRLARAAKAQES